jgi:hypothetical protein
MSPDGHAESAVSALVSLVVPVSSTHAIAGQTCPQVITPQLLHGCCPEGQPVSVVSVVLPVSAAVESDAMESVVVASLPLVVNVAPLHAESENTIEQRVSESR